MRPFENIRVLDLTHVLAGPFSTYQLAVLGADVIKIEAPDRPDMTREEEMIEEFSDQLMGTYFQGQNGGKRSLTLDIKSERGRDILKKLAASADVMVENYRGGKMEALGLGYDALSSINPNLIYCSISGFGATGPKAQHPAYDAVIQAYTGIMAANGTPETAPIQVGPPMVDFGTGAHAALAISAALFQRTFTGKGQRIDVAMMDAALMLWASDVTSAIDTGLNPSAGGNIHPHYAGYSAYETANGQLMIGAWTNKQLSDLMRAVGEEARADEILNTTRKEIRHHREADMALLQPILKQRSADEWEDHLNKYGVPAARVRSLTETLGTEQLKSRRCVQPAVDQSDYQLSGYPIAAFSYQHGSPKLDRPPPQLGEHNEEILAEIGYSDAELAALCAEGVISKTSLKL